MKCLTKLPTWALVALLVAVVALWVSAQALILWALVNMIMALSGLQHFGYMWFWFIAFLLNALLLAHEVHKGPYGR